ncbi:MAG: carbon starvation protein A [Planctomycetes bacterium]|nr:carbon starvation protein A [Planctomycetota bacterium]
MTLAPLVLLCLGLFVLAYLLYGRLLARLFRLDAKARTPAHERCDGVDYVPTSRFYLLSQHFSAISAAGPIAGPILACTMFGWEPALLWIVLGSIFIGAMHDFAALIGSVRHGGCSVAEILKRHLNPRTYALFSLYIWFALIYVILAFTDVTARAFVENLEVEVGTTGGTMLRVPGAGVASASMLYLGLGLLLGVVTRYLRWRVAVQTLVFVPLVGVAIWLGPHLPLDLSSGGEIPSLTWAWLILGYCGVASLLPVWLLLQPRGYLGGFFLYLTLGGGLVGLLVANPEIRFDAFAGFTARNGQTLYPFLFITIACGACSGFHGLVCSGTTSKQIDREPDAHAVGYGAMLLEGVVAILALACVMWLAKDAALIGKGPDKVFGYGVGSFLNALGVPLHFAVTFGMLAFATFVYDTLDVCTRLARYLFQEFTGWRGPGAAVAGTLVSLAIPLWAVAQTARDPTGAVVPAYRVVWPLFGSTNQLLAALTLVALTLWLTRTGRPLVVRLLVGLPALFMLATTMTALWLQVRSAWTSPGSQPIVYVGALLMVLAAWVSVEAMVALRAGRTRAA